MLRSRTLSADSVLVEAAATSVNPIDWKIRSGARQKDFPLKLPAILGRDVSGVVRAVGRNIRTFKPGDRVLAMADCDLRGARCRGRLDPHACA